MTCAINGKPCAVRTEPIWGPSNPPEELRCGEPSRYPPVLAVAPSEIVESAVPFVLFDHRDGASLPVGADVEVTGDESWRGVVVAWLESTVWVRAV